MGDAEREAAVSRLGESLRRLSVHYPWLFDADREYCDGLARAVFDAVDGDLTVMEAELARIDGSGGDEEAR